MEPSRSTPPVLSYERRMAANPRWAMDEGERFFHQDSEVHKTLRAITARLDQLGIPYSVAGGLALNAHGYRRFTEDVDILITREGLRRVQAELVGRGYVLPFRGSKNLKDAEHGVKVEFLITGDYPGDGKPKPVSFPNPATVATTIDGICYLGLPSLVELKIASGMTNAARLKDLADVVELIKLLSLPAGFADKLDPYVREKFVELWHSVQKAPRRFVRLWRNKFLTIDAKSIDEMAATLRAATEELDAMRRDGVFLDEQGGTADDYALLVTTNPDVAKKYDMEDEETYWGESESKPEGH